MYTFSQGANHGTITRNEKKKKKKKKKKPPARD